MCKLSNFFSSVKIVLYTEMSAVTHRSSSDPTGCRNHYILPDHTKPLNKVWQKQRHYRSLKLSK